MTDRGWVDVFNAKIYWEATGNPAGIPVLYLHGGPGGSLGQGCYRQRHDHNRFRIIGLDQRGGGNSAPAAQDCLDLLPENTTQALIGDIEALRKHLGIEQWIVTGVSWGSTLALAYALENPRRVLGIAMVAVTTHSLLMHSRSCRGFTSSTASPVTSSTAGGTSAVLPPRHGRSTGDGSQANSPSSRTKGMADQHRWRH